MDRKGAWACIGRGILLGVVVMVIGCGSTPEHPEDRAPTGDVTEIPIEYTYLVSSSGWVYDFWAENHSIFDQMKGAFKGAGQTVLMHCDSAIVDCGYRFYHLGPTELERLQEGFQAQCRASLLAGLTAGSDGRWSSRGGCDGSDSHYRT